jgi:hypothetical protein
MNSDSAFGTIFTIFKDAINVYIYILFINAGKKFAHLQKVLISFLGLQQILTW